MNRLTLLIAYESADGSKALPVARVDARDALVTAARRAIDEKRSEAARFATADETLGMLAIEEASRLERTLAVLIPELRAVDRVPMLAM